MTDALQFLRDNGYLAPRLLPEKRWAAVVPLVEGHGRIIAGTLEGLKDGYDDGW